ncbi:MAG: MBOAT family O-acyltransferase [Bdellovibrionota bacterium]
MFSNPQLYIFWLVLTCFIYWVIPHLKVRKAFLLTSSVVFLFSIAPYAVYAGIYFISLSLIWNKIWSKKRNSLTFWLSILSALLPLYLSRSASAFQTPLFAFGLAFMTVRAIGILLDLYRATIRVSTFSESLYLFFFPIYSAGPVENLSTFSPAAYPKSASLSLIVTSCFLLIVGIFKTTFISEAILMTYMKSNWPDLVLNPEVHSTTQAWQFTFIRFLHTYINFSGYSDIAIGSGGLFGFKIQENFNFPFLAKNMQEFWKRWHMSMGAWIMRYVFFPLLAIFRTDKGIIFSSMMTFILMGLWHESSWTYFVWGLGHGIGMAVNHLTAKHFSRTKTYKAMKTSAAVSFFSILLTLTYASFLQTFANMPTWNDGVNLVKMLLGWGS